MGNIIENVDPWVIALTFAVAMISAWSFGWWRGRQQRPEPGQDPGVKFTDSTMALLVCCWDLPSRCRSAATINAVP